MASAQAGRRAAPPGLQALTTFVSGEDDFNGVKGGTNFSTDPADYERIPFIRSDTHGLLPFLFAALEMERLSQKK